MGRLDKTNSLNFRKFPNWVDPKSVKKIRKEIVWIGQDPTPFPAFPVSNYDGHIPSYDAWNPKFIMHEL